MKGNQSNFAPVNGKDNQLHVLKGTRILTFNQVVFVRICANGTEHRRYFSSVSQESNWFLCASSGVIKVPPP